MPPYPAGCGGFASGTTVSARSMAASIRGTLSKASATRVFISTSKLGMPSVDRLIFDTARLSDNAV